jgi:hypothetical protein
MKCAVCNAEIPAGRNGKTCGATQCGRLFSLKRKAVVEKSSEWSEKARKAGLAQATKASSGYRGVYQTGKKTWKVRVGDKTLGYFNNPIDAAIAYNDAAFELWGSQAILNVLPIDWTI